MSDQNTSTDSDKTKAFLRYIASVASKVASGETDPSQINWSYIRDQAFLAVNRDD